MFTVTLGLSGLARAFPLALSFYLPPSTLAGALRGAHVDLVDHYTNRDIHTAEYILIGSI